MVGHTRPPRRPVLRGFTLIELLVVIAIIAVLAALMFPAARSFIAKGQQAKCTANLRQVGIGTQGFLGENGVYPLSRGFTEPGVAWEGPFWADHIEPYTGSTSSKEIKNKGLTGRHCYYCPSFPLHHEISDYGGNPKVFVEPTNEIVKRGLPAARVQQPARTILALCCGRIWPGSGKLIGTWITPAAWLNNPPAAIDQSATSKYQGPQPVHNNQLNVLFCDGRVQAMTYEQLLELHRAKAFEIEK
jgi:prepilin-type N-terminal cleavage/methylation domain-containing protein/prepilin-type processing-associated H-X9-DG protein